MAEINLASSAGTNKTTPVSGDLWWNGTNLYFYNGATNKDLLASGASIGSAISGSTAGSVLYAGAAGVLAQDNTVFNYDYTDHTLGVGTTGKSTSRVTIQGTTADTTASALNATD